MDKPVKILQIVGSMHPGGIENFVMNLYEHIDREQFPFDFVVHKQQAGDYTERIEELGGKSYLLSRLTRNPIRNLRGIYRLVKENHYDIVIRHTPNALIAPQLLAARLAGAHTICHAHSETDRQKVLHILGKGLLKIAAERRIACSVNAGRWMFGKQHYEIVHNAVDISLFQYSREKEESIRKEFQLGERHIYGHVGNFVWSKNKVLKWNQVKHGEEYRYTVGRSTDAMMGLVAEGLFGKDVAINGHAPQTFADYQEGDIAYKDLNGDKIIDGRDVKELGNSFPRTTLGIDLNVSYKGWGLYLQGYSELGVHTWATNAYYWNNGEGKYSKLALDRYHPANNPTGSYPRLTTTAGENNFRNSSFWLKNTSFFRMKNVELSYTFNQFSPSSVVKKMKVFARGANLFVLSSVKDLDPELLNAGVTNYPVTRTFTGGVSFVF